MKIIRVGISAVLVISQIVIFASTSVWADQAGSLDLTQINESPSSETSGYLSESEKVIPQNSLEEIQPKLQAGGGDLSQEAQAQPTVLSQPMLLPLRITEVQVSGVCEPSICSGNNVEFIELFNPNDDEVSLKNYSLFYQNSSGTRTLVASFSDAMVLAPKQFGLVSRNASFPNATILTTTKTTLADSAGALLLLPAVNSSDVDLIDQIAWGAMTVGFYGGKAAIAPATNKSLQRCFDEQGLREYDPRSTEQEFKVYANELPTPGIGLECEKPTPVQPVNNCEGLKISEIGANLERQYIELRNHSQKDLDITGCQLQTNRSTTKSHVFTQEILAPGGIKLVYISDTSLTLTKTTSGVVYVLSSDAQTEIDTQAYSGLATGTAWAYFADGWLQTYIPTPGTENVAQKYLACDDGYQRNFETGRCNKIAISAVLADCGEGRFRSEETGRCRAIPEASMLAACKLGQYRSEETNRCRNIVTASTQKPCKDNQYRSEETNRCRNLPTSSVPEAAFAVQPIKDTGLAFVGWWALGGVVLLAGGYAIWEWRRELAVLLAKTSERFRIK